MTYWMRVKDIVDFDQYWASREFLSKRPVLNGSLMQRYGDNIYHRDNAGAWVQANSFHSSPDGSPDPGNLNRDTGTTDRVLLGSEYAYWGGEGPPIPEHLKDFVHTTQGHRCRYSAERIAAFLNWLDGVPRPVLIGRPANWPATKR